MRLHFVWVCLWIIFIVQLFSKMYYSKKNVTFFWVFTSQSSPEESSVWEFSILCSSSSKQKWSLSQVYIMGFSRENLTFFNNFTKILWVFKRTHFFHSLLIDLRVNWYFVTYQYGFIASWISLWIKMPLFGTKSLVSAGDGFTESALFFLEIWWDFFTCFELHSEQTLTVFSKTLDSSSSSGCRFVEDISFE